VSPRALLLVAATALGACNPSSEADFTSGRGFNPCQQVIPACSGQYAGCVLDDQGYTRAIFPGSVRFMTPADPETDIEVRVFLSVQRDAGVSTQVYWTEPACSDIYTYDSEGRNLFQDAADHVLRFRHSVHEGGDHLVEIVTDMQAEVIVAPFVIEPGS
jgi:hypothetical protein